MLRRAFACCRICFAVSAHRPAGIPIFARSLVFMNEQPTASSLLCRGPVSLSFDGPASRVSRAPPPAGRRTRGGGGGSGYNKQLREAFEWIYLHVPRRHRSAEQSRLRVAGLCRGQRAPIIGTAHVEPPVTC